MWEFIEHTNNNAIFSFVLHCITAGFVAELSARRRIVKRVPKGTSEYQAAWIVDSEEEVCILCLWLH